MKKHVIIGFVVLAVMIFFGSCELQKGGTIKVENTSSDYPVNIYITKKAGLLMTTPPSDYVATKTIAKGATGEIVIDEDGTYYIYAFFNMSTATPNVPGTVAPVMAILSLGSTTSVKATPIL